MSWSVRVRVDSLTGAYHAAYLDSKLPISIGGQCPARTDVDRRAATVEIAPDGEEMYNRISSVAISSQQDMLKGLSDREVAQLATLLDRILENVGPR